METPPSSQTAADIVSSDLPAPPSSHESIDKITLELLMNKNHYNRYMSETNPQKYRAEQEHLQDIKKYRDSILEITTELLINPKKQISNTISEEFDSYVRTLIGYFKMKELENATNQYGDDNAAKDEDVLFGEMSAAEPTHSFWGKERVLKESASMTNFFTKTNIWKTAPPTSNSAR
jgi:hypothetical protein